MSMYPRTIMMCALLGATLLSGPLVAMADDSVPATASPPAPATAAAETPRETIEQRITSLHASLNITPAEETDWNGVSRAMRDSADVMRKLIAERSASSPANVTALDDLKMYQKFAQAHADGLKKLTLSFAKLYKSMPDAQKKVADQVFQNFAHERSPTHS